MENQITVNKTTTHVTNVIQAHYAYYDARKHFVVVKKCGTKAL
ncbi:unnamed protein product [Brassica oleracea]